MFWDLLTFSSNRPNPPALIVVFQPLLVTLLPSMFSSFTYLRFRWSFWGSYETKCKYFYFRTWQIENDKWLFYDLLCYSLSSKQDNHPDQRCFSKKPAVGLWVLSNKVRLKAQPLKSLIILIQSHICACSNCCVSKKG